MTGLQIRPATAADAGALHALISEHRHEGHLLPREPGDVARHVGHFVVCDVDGVVKACAALAPLSKRVAEVRSLVVAREFRRAGLAARLVGELQARARTAGFETLCAFTHDARFFVRQNFSIVPHLWFPEKITTDCLGCPLFRRCGQYAMILPLREVSTLAVAPAAGQRRAVVAQGAA